MSQVDPDDEGRGADASGCSTTFDEIVASWRAEGSVPVWPDADPGCDPATAPLFTDPRFLDPRTERSSPGNTTESAGAPPTSATDPTDEDHYIPPEPPPLPRLGPPAAVGLALLVLGVVLVAAPQLVGLADSAGLPLGLLSLALGLGWLVLRSWPSDPPEDGDGDDDGAVL
jgi:hypothetical protein